MLIFLDCKPVIYLIMAVVNLIVTQSTPARDCLSSCLFYRILLVLYTFQLLIASLKNGKDDIMEPIQRHCCCKLAPGFHGVRRRTSAISNCKISFRNWSPIFQGNADQKQLHEKFVEELGWIDEVMVSSREVGFTSNN